MNWEQIYETGNRAFAGGLYSAALTSYLQALESATESGDQQAIAHTQRGLSKTYLEIGKVEEAKEAAAGAGEIDRTFWGYDNQEVAEDKFLLAECLRRQGNFEEARELFEEVLTLRSNLFGETHDDSLEVIVRLIWLDAQEDRSEGLTNHLRRAEEIFSRLHPSGALTKALNLRALLQPYRDEHRLQEAELIAQRILQAMRTVFGGAHPELRHAFAECSTVMKMANKNLSAWRLQAQSDLLQRKESANSQLQADEPLQQNMNRGVVDSKLDLDSVHLVEDGPSMMASANANEASPTTEDAASQSLVSFGGQTSISNEGLVPPRSNAWDEFVQSSPMYESGQSFPSDQSGPSSRSDPSGPSSSFDQSGQSFPSDQSGQSSSSDQSGQDESGQTVPIDGSSQLDRYLCKVLALADLSIKPEQLRRLWIRTAAGCGILSAVLYLVGGYWYLICDAFVAGCLICTAGICIYLAAAAILHQKKLDAQVPNALEIMVSSLRAGAPITEIFKVLSETMPLPIRAEFERTIALMKDGRSLQQALKELTLRVRSHDLVLLSDAIQVSHDTRGNLADHVATISAACRERQSTRSSLSLSNTRMQILMILAGGMSVMVALGVMIDPAFGASMLSSIAVRLFIYMAFVVVGMVAFLSASPAKADEVGQKIGAVAQAKAAEDQQAKAHDPIANNVGRLSAYLHKIQMQDRIRRELSNFLEMVVMYVESGVGLLQAVHKVRTKANASCPNLCRELDCLLANPTSYKSALPDAFRTIGEKYDVKELLNLAGTIAAAEKTKSSIAMQFSEQAKFLRKHIESTQKERAAAGFTIAMVIGVCFAVIISVVSMIFGGH